MTKHIIAILSIMLIIVILIITNADRNQCRDKLERRDATIQRLEGIIADMPEVELGKSNSEVPEWFAKELNNTINHGAIRIKFGLAGEDEDVVIMSGKALDRLERLAKPRKYNDNSGIILRGCWDYWKTYDPEDEEVQK